MNKSNYFSKGRLFRGALVVILLMLAVTYGLYDLADLPWIILITVIFVVVGEYLSRSNRQRPVLSVVLTALAAVGTFLIVWFVLNP